MEGHVAVGVDSEALGVRGAAEGDRRAVARAVLAVGAVALDRAPAVDGADPGQVREVRVPGGCRGWGGGAVAVAEAACTVQPTGARRVTAAEFQGRAETLTRVAITVNGSCRH
ncbi:hypothetical protein AQF52_0715 [Streptomyces venezuelae]|nr:hypothetical protein AQF52_0715 [Streptomyces venezuelae]CUM43434.1 hypothetical protein BN2537_15833 [Streptomyces venezuelae]